MYRCGDAPRHRYHPTALESRLAELREAAKVRRGCPVCGCTVEGPRCTIDLGDGQIASCAPAGVDGLDVCSACSRKAEGAAP